MNDINQTKQNVQAILAKEKGLPITKREKALMALYGNLAPTATPKTEVEIKGAFVAQYLSPLLANAGVGVTTATYMTVNGEEYVILTYERTARKKRMSVTCDSLMALVKDVIEGVHGGGQWL